MSTSTVPLALRRWSACTMPLTMSPSLPAYSPKVCSCSASRSRCTMTCLAVLAAIRPKSEGVSSHSRTTSPSVAELLGEDGDLTALAVDVHAHVLGRAVGVPVGGDQRRLDGLDHRVGGDALLPLDRLEGGHVDVHCLLLAVGCRPRHRPSGAPSVASVVTVVARPVAGPRRARTPPAPGRRPARPTGPAAASGGRFLRPGLARAPRRRGSRPRRRPRSPGR